MTKRFIALLAAGIAGTTLAQGPQAPRMTPEQAQQAMMQQQMLQMQLMSVMFDLRKSRYGFDETVNRIRDGATRRGWQIGEIKDVQSAMREAGAKDAKRMKVISLCPAGANDRVSKAGDGKAPPLPCRVTVFEGKDGAVHLVRMNVSNVARAMQGDLARTLAEIGAEEDALYKDIVE